MRPFLLITTIIASLCIITTGYSQDNNELTLHTFTIEVNGNPVLIDTTIYIPIKLDNKVKITIYSDDNLKYMGEFTYKRNNNSLKLIRRFHVIRNVEKPIFSKTKKDVQYIKVSIPKKITGKSSEHLVINKEKSELIFVSFNYEFTYQ